LRVQPLEGTDGFLVSGRGLLHLSVLIETMRREGFELSVGKPRVILHTNGGVVEEPFESLVVEVPHDKLGPVMEMVGSRRGRTVEMHTRGEYAHLLFSIPARGLIGLRTRLLNATQGTAILHHRFECYRPLEGDIGGRGNGVLVSMVGGRVNGYALKYIEEDELVEVTPDRIRLRKILLQEHERRKEERRRA
jgi:GTP-binding protein